MKLKSILMTVTLAMFTGATAIAIAAEAEKQETVTAKQGESGKPAKKPMKKHSHMEEKTGMPMAEPKSHEDQAMPKNRHDHMQEKR